MVRSFGSRKHVLPRIRKDAFGRLFFWLVLRAMEAESLLRARVPVSPRYNSKEFFAFLAIRPKLIKMAQSAMIFGTDSDQEMPPIRSSVATKANTATSKLTKIPGMNNLELILISMLLASYRSFQKANFQVTASAPAKMAGSG